MTITYNDSIQVKDPAAVGILLDPANTDPKVRAKAVFEVNRQRLDALLPGQGIHLARELEYSYQHVVEQKYEELQALSLFPVDGEVPAGALTYRITSEDSAGSARYHRGESYATPSVALSRNEEIRSVRHIINGFSLDLFEMKSAAFSGQNIRARMERAAKRAMDTFLDSKTWLGSSADDVYGVLSYPYVPKTSSSVTISSATAATTILAELVRLAQLQYKNTKQVFSPDTMALPTSQFEYISATMLDIGNGATETIKEAFLRTNGHVNEVISVPFLDGQGPGGLDIILLMKRNDSMAIANVIPQGFTMLPAETQGFQMQVNCYMSHGGVRMWYPLNNLVCYTPAVA